MHIHILYMCLCICLDIHIYIYNADTYIYIYMCMQRVEGFRVGVRLHLGLGGRFCSQGLVFRDEGLGFGIEVQD